MLEVGNIQRATRACQPRQENMSIRSSAPDRSRSHRLHSRIEQVLSVRPPAHTGVTHTDARAFECCKKMVLVMPPFQTLSLRRETQTGMNGKRRLGSEWPTSQAKYRMHPEYGAPLEERRWPWIDDQEVADSPELLQYVNNDQLLANSGKTYATLCRIACSNKGYALQWVKMMYLPGIGEAYRKDSSGDFTCYMEICEHAVRQNPSALSYMKDSYKNIQSAGKGWHLGKIFKIAVEKEGKALMYIPTRTQSFEKLATIAVNQDAWAIAHVPPLRTYYEELARVAIKKLPNVIHEVPQAHPKYEALMMLALSQIDENAQIDKEQIDKQVQIDKEKIDKQVQIDKEFMERYRNSIRNRDINEIYPGPDSDDEEEEKEEFANNIEKYWNKVDEFGSPIQYWNNVDDFGNVEGGPPEQPHEPKYFVYL